jgi:hypothetical protein
MHILFKDDQRIPPVRRLLMSIDAKSPAAAPAAAPAQGSTPVAPATKGFSKAIETKIQAAAAKELKLSIAQLAVSSYPMPDGIMHTELRFKGEQSILLGYKLERSVLANQFNPVPDYPIHRLYMEEIFDCGEHAIGATHSFDGTNGGSVAAKFTLPDSGWRVPTV